MNIGIDIDGVLTNDDDYLMDTITKFNFENNLEGLKSPYDYEYNKAALIKEYGEDYIDPTPQILWSNDGKYLIIGEKEKGSIKISNIKVLELSQ